MAENQQDVLAKEKIEFYKSEDIALHITLLSSKLDYSGVRLKKWFNGKVIKVNDSNFIFEEEKLGKVIIFFKEIIEIEPRKDKGADTTSGDKGDDIFKEYYGDSGVEGINDKR